MLYAFFHFGGKALKFCFLTALVLAYVEIGPVGDSLMVVVEAMKEAILSVDWEGVISHLIETGKEVIDEGSKRLEQS